MEKCRTKENWLAVGDVALLTIWRLLLIQVYNTWLCGELGMRRVLK